MGGSLIGQRREEQVQREEPEPRVEEGETLLRGTHADGVQQRDELRTQRGEVLQHDQEQNVHRLAVDGQGTETRAARQQGEHGAGLLDAGVVQLPGHSAALAQRLKEAEEDEKVFRVVQVVGQLRVVGEEDAQRLKHHAHVRVVHRARVARHPHAALLHALALCAEEGKQSQEVLRVLDELLGLLLVEDAHVHVRDDQLVLDRIEHEL